MTPEERAVQVAEALFAGERPCRIATSSLIATAIADAVAAERERCAKVARKVGRRLCRDKESIQYRVGHEIAACILED